MTRSCPPLSTDQKDTPSMQSPRGERNILVVAHTVAVRTYRRSVASQP